MVEISELQRDALAELFNVGVGRAASTLSQIVGQEVELSAPVVNLVQPSQVSRILMGSTFRKLSTVSQDFSGPFDAKAMLVFPEANALVIVSHMLDADMSPEELSEFEQEAMCEVGNIILNACVSALADLFEVEFHGDFPVHQFSDTNSIALFGDDDTQAVLTLQVNLSISKEEIEGHLLYLLSVSSLQALLECLQGYLVKQGMA